MDTSEQLIEAHRYEDAIILLNSRLDAVDKSDIKESMRIVSNLFKCYHALKDDIRLSQCLDATLSINPCIENLLLIGQIYYECGMYFKSSMAYKAVCPLLSIPTDIKHMSWSMVFVLSTCSSLLLNSQDDESVIFLERVFNHIVQSGTLQQEHSEFAHCYLMMQNLVLNIDNPSRRMLINREWNRHTLSIERCKPQARRIRDGDRLNIGYLTTHLGSHAVFFFSSGMFMCHDRRRYNIFIYGERTKNMSPETERVLSDIERHANVRYIHDKSDTDVCNMIMDDNIDVLIEMIGYTYKDKINVLLRKPAPIIISMVGFPASLGLDVIDYKVVDRYTHHDDFKSEFTERPLILERGTQCYWNMNHSFDNSRWATSNEVRIAVFSFPAKLTGDFYDALGKIMHTVTNSRVIFCYPHNRCRFIQNILRTNLTKRGIVSDRIEIITETAMNIFEMYQNMIDISLDTYPYNGATTICDALWCGVPVITLRGDTYVSRMGYSILSCCGCQELVADSWQDYVKKTVELAQSPDRLRWYHLRLHDMFMESHVGNPELFTRQFEAAIDGLRLRHLQ